MKELRGTGVALATPLTNDLEVDFEALEKLLEHVIKGGVDYLVVQGTTGESPVFSWEEKLNILSFIIEKNNGRKPVVFGHGGNNTHELIRKSKDLAGYPIEAILSVSPYYSRPSQEGIKRHFTLLADSFPKPVLLYNVPSRTACNMEAATTLALASHPNIIGIKEAAGDLSQCEEIVKHASSDFALISGDDQDTFELVKMGAIGVISVISNILPAEFSKMVNHALNGDFSKAEELNSKLKPVYRLLSKEGNPTSLKGGLSVLGIGSDTVRPPLFEATEQLKNEWRDILATFKA